MNYAILSKKIFTLQNVKFYILKCQGRTTQPMMRMSEIKKAAEQLNTKSIL